MAASALGAGVVALQIAWLRGGWWGPHGVQAFSDLIPLPVIGAGVVACRRVARASMGSARRGWILIACAIGSWGVGEAIWSWHELVFGTDVPFPSAADLGFLAFIPFAVAAMLAFRPSARRAEKYRSLLDGSIIAGASLFVAWSLVLGDAFAAAEGSILASIIGLAYPVGDLVILVLVLIIAGRAPGTARVPMSLVAGGLVSIALSDSGFTYLTNNGTYATGSLIDAGWTAGFVLICLGAMRGRYETLPDDRSSASRQRHAIPSIAFGGLIVVAGIEQTTAGALGPFLFWTACSVAGLIVVRQWLTVRDNVVLARTLEEQVLERTRQLENANTELESARSLQDDFVANVSHELRTPLTTLLGATSTLTRDDVDLEAYGRPFAEVAHRGAQRMAQIVEDLLIVSAIADDLRCSRSPVNLAPTLGDAAQQVLTSGRSVATELAGDLVVLGDGQRIGTAIGHIVGNAIKFSPADSCVFIEASPRDDRIEIFIGDEGPGIPFAARERVFERFYQIDSSTTRPFGGAGLGLFIARRLIEGMGGAVRIEDTSRGGTTVRITLPAARALSSSARDATATSSR